MGIPIVRITMNWGYWGSPKFGETTTAPGRLLAEVISGALGHTVLHPAPLTSHLKRSTPHPKTLNLREQGTLQACVCARYHVHILNVQAEIHRVKTRACTAMCYGTFRPLQPLRALNRKL